MSTEKIDKLVTVATDGGEPMLYCTDMPEPEPAPQAEFPALYFSIDGQEMEKDA